MAFPQGVYFRLTDNQTDPENYEAEIGTTANYPRTTDLSNSVGWEQALGANTRDRSSTGPVHTRGIAQVNGSTICDYRIALPSTGTYNIRAAFGDAGGSPSNCRAQFLDDTTVFATPLDLASQSTGQYIDATGASHTGGTAWLADNVALERTFTSTIFRMRLGRSGGTRSAIAALYIESAGGGPVLVKYWSVPTSAVDSTVRELAVMSDDRTTVIDLVEATATGGFFLAQCTNQSQIVGTKRFVVLHNWDGSMLTSSIRGGLGIAEVVEV